MGLLLVTSCSSEETATPIEVVEIKKEMSVEMENFRESMIDWMMAKHQSKVSKRDENHNSILMEESRLLLESNGVQLESINGKQAISESEIISKAMRLYAQKTNVTLNLQK